MKHTFALASQSIRSVLVAFRRSVPKVFADPYRPELHYMRGPGPKWREKHQGTSVRTLAPSDERDLAPAVTAA
jgi:hypothetical protein